MATLSHTTTLTTDATTIVTYRKTVTSSIIIVFHSFLVLLSFSIKLLDI